MSRGRKCRVEKSLREHQDQSWFHFPTRKTLSSYFFYRISSRRSLESNFHRQLNFSSELLINFSRVKKNSFSRYTGIVQLNKDGTRRRDWDVVKGSLTAPRTFLCDSVAKDFFYHACGREFDSQLKCKFSDFPHHLWLLLSDYRGIAKWFVAHYDEERGKFMP